MSQVVYKLFRVNKKYPGQLFPLYVNADEPVPMNVWVEAKSGEKIGEKVKSRLGPLAYRPGWHSSDYPLATHIGVKDENGVIKYMHKDEVWCACEYSDNIDYQEQANENGHGSKKKSYLKDIPENGFYRYKTNPNQFGDWIISGKIKINRVLSDEEVASILEEHSLPVMPREGGNISLKDYGF